MHYFFFSSITSIHTILVEFDQSSMLHLNTLQKFLAASQLGFSSNNPRICNFLPPCQQPINLQSRSVCAVIKPLCPVIKLSCSICRFYFPTAKSCRKTCQSSKKYCGSSGCGSSSSEPSQPVTEISDDGKKN